MSKIDLVPVTGAQNLSAINDNFEKVAEALNNKALYRDNPSGEPNQMDSTLDMNGKRIYNLPEPVFDHEPVRKKEMGDVKKSLRVSDRELPPLPGVAARRNKIVSFDNNGNPEVRFPSADSATKLRQDLTSFTGTISADSEWTDVPAHTDTEFDAQARALANRTKLLYDDSAVSTAKLGIVGDGVTDVGARIRKMYQDHRVIRWSKGTYLLSFAGADSMENFVRVYAGTTTIFEPGVVILKDPSSGTSGIFCNTDRDDTSTTGYNGDGNIHFFGDPEFALYGGAVANMEPFAFVHARNISIVGKGIIRGWEGRHAMEFNACADWVVRGYKFQNQTTPSGSEALSECIQWDGAFQAGNFPFGQGAIDNTPCDNFEISGCEFEDIYTAYGAHHTDFGGVKHTRPRIFGNVIKNAKSSGERLRHLKGGFATGQVINKTADRATNPRECIGLYQDGYSITDGGNTGTSVVFFQTSQDCVWGPNSVIKYSGSGTRHSTVFETGSTNLPSSGIIIHEGKCDRGSSELRPILWDASEGVTGNVLLGGSTSNNIARERTLGRFFQSFNLPVVPTGNYLLLAKVADTNHSVFGKIYARRYRDSGSGSQSVVVEIFSAAGADGARRTIWNQSYEQATNAVSLVTLTYAGEQWLALKPSTTSLRGFTAGGSFVGFAEDPASQFLSVAASSVSSIVALPSGGVTHFSTGLRIDGSTVILGGLPTSASGLPAGSVWRSGNDLKIV